MDNSIDKIANALIEHALIEVEASGRHVHLSPEDAEFLFGTGYVFQQLKPLSQPGQFACVERVDLISDKGTLKNVAILGPCRGKTQIEISLTDARVLGVAAPIRQSGDVTNSPGITLCANGKQLPVQEGVIVAKRHIHLTPQAAKKFKVTDNQIVKLKVFGKRPLIFDDTVVRVSKNYADRVHLDFDEANACGFTDKSRGVILKNG